MSKDILDATVVDPVKEEPSLSAKHHLNDPCFKVEETIATLLDESKGMALSRLNQNLPGASVDPLVK